jgi:ankyrin repeat protein
LAHGADPNVSDEDGRSAYRAATAAGRSDLAELLLVSGARDDTTAVDRLLSACLHADEAAARRELDSSPGVLERPAEVLGAAAHQAPESGLAAAIELMLELGFPINATAGADGGTLLHAAAYSGSAEVVHLLVGRGADLEAKDARWDSTALEWAAVGSGERPTTNPASDWTAVVKVLLDSGASADGIGLEPDEPKPPSRDVANLLRSRS